MNVRVNNIIKYPNMEQIALTSLLTMTLGLIAYRYSKINQEIHKKKAERGYAEWKTIVKGIALPAVFVDLDAFYENLTKLTRLVEESNEKNKHKLDIRLATKSLRSPELIQLALEKGGPLMKGLMCYSAEEADFLWQKNIGNDYLIAYPTVQEFDLTILRNLHLRGAKVQLVLDSIEQMEVVSQIMKELDKENPFPIVIELDTSIRFWNGFIHLGARRSPVHTLTDLKNILEEAKQFSCLQIVGVMAYESILSLTDRNPHKNFLMNAAAWLVRQASASYTAKIRAGVPQVFADAGVELKIFNGGGTPSINFTANEDSGLTELTFGSGILNPALFDYYQNLKSIMLKPSLFFAIPVSRSSDQNYVTAYEGGYPASGPAGQDRLPIVVAPAGIKPTENEGYGEVQTPFNVTFIKPEVGDPIICRPPKSGELAKSFKSYYTFFKTKDPEKPNDNKYEKLIVKTYRGYGKQF